MVGLDSGRVMIEKRPLIGSGCAKNVTMYGIFGSKMDRVKKTEKSFLACPNQKNIDPDQIAGQKNLYKTRPKIGSGRVELINSILN